MQPRTSTFCSRSSILARSAISWPTKRSRSNAP
uniref:Uncharacterized protein n=1 Tax=Globisporangium ultimum (strain ATCC 200006 / CBS 805.95 / DAOM BR144) TaxID=431595 RepID=K3W5I6_GLOUD